MGGGKKIVAVPEERIGKQIVAASKISMKLGSTAKLVTYKVSI